MGNYIGGLSGIEQPLAQWEDIWGTVENNRQQRWVNREARTVLDRENRRQRDLSQVELDAQARRAGLFAGVDPQFNSMGRLNVPIAGPTSGLASEQVAGNAQLADYMTRPANQLSDGVRALSLTSEEMNSLFTHRGGSRLSSRQYTAQELQSNPGLRDILQRGQQYGQLQIDEVQNENGEAIYRVQRRTQGTVSEQNFAVQEPNTLLGVPLTGEDARNMRGSPMLPLNPEYGRNRRRNNRDIEERSRTTNTRLPDGSVSSSDTGSAVTVPIPPAYENTGPEPQPQDNEGLDYGPNTETLPGGLEPPDANAFYRGDPDTSAALVATPEMQMIRETVLSEIERANVNARYGNSEQAQVHFAQAMQGQAAYLQQSRLVMLRAATQGHRTALADLLGVYSGRPAGTTRLAPVNQAQDQFHIEVLNNEGQWVSATSNPLTLRQLVERAEFLVDRESVMARSEANSEIIRAQIAAGADITVAQIGALTAQQRMYADAIANQADNETREAISQGEGELVVDSTNNRVYYRRWERGPDGSPREIITEYSEQDVRVPDTNGRRTERQMVGRNITGTVGVRAN